MVRREADKEMSSLEQFKDYIMSNLGLKDHQIDEYNDQGVASIAEGRIREVFSCGTAVTITPVKEIMFKGARLSPTPVCLVTLAAGGMALLRPPRGAPSAPPDRINLRPTWLQTRSTPSRLPTARPAI